VIVAFPAGGSVDVMGRNLVAAMSTLLNQQFVVVNRDGASGSVGFGQLAAARPDGYTLGAGPTTPIATAPHLIKDIKYSVDSFEYICQSFENVFTVSVPPESPFRSMADVIAAARANPGKLSYGHSGNGTVPHLSVAHLAYRLGLDVVAVAYRGETAALPDVIAGRLISARRRSRWWWARRCACWRCSPTSATLRFRTRPPSPSWACPRCRPD
jgi:tripartite-type tricarboxylate transporter receptor subunit TctC